MNAGSASPTPTMVNMKSGNHWREVKAAILVRSFSQSGGLELYAYKLVEGLLARGLNVTVICQEAKAQLHHEKLKVVQIPDYKTGAGKAEQLEHCFKEFSNALNRLGPFDIVHSHHIGANPVNVVTFHNHTVYRIEESGKTIEAEINKFKLMFRSDYKVRLDMDTRLIKSADVLIFPSRVCKQDFIKHFRLNRPASLVVAYPGWQLADHGDVEKTSPADRQQSGPVDLPADHDRERTIIFVGRGYRKKGLDILLLACSILKSKNYSFKLLIAGLDEKVIDRWRLHWLGLNKCVSYLGFQSDMDSLYSAASMIVLPSRVEPFGMAVLQGMSRGLVPVVSKVSGVAELLSDGKDALILENHLDAGELAQKLAYLLDNPDQLSSLSRQAQIKAKATNWQSTIDTTLAAYRQVFQKRYIV
jgi:UDP-glucose:(heptosyl)LPS alpha-1,3-glucosyltransferase